MKILDVARYLIYLSYNVRIESLTPLKMQKLLYFCQGWSYVWDEKPLFNQKFEAWQYGPVNPDVYDYFKAYRAGEIPEHEGSVPHNLTEDEQETIEVVWKKYCEKSAFGLVEMTHEAGPWKDAYENDVDISNREIRKFFQSMYS